MVAGRLKAYRLAGSSWLQTARLLELYPRHPYGAEDDEQGGTRADDLRSDIGFLPGSAGAVVSVGLPDLLGDLEREHAALDGRVAGLSEAQWRTPTPACGWDVADCVSHLQFFDATAVLSLTDEAAFGAHVAEVFAVGLDSVPDTVLGRAGEGRALLGAWRQGRALLLAQASAADPAQRVAWYGPPMSLSSFVTARLMETWAHGQDVADALGLDPVVSDRLRHVCHLGVGARAFAYRAHELTDGGVPVRVELTGPGAGTWGPEDAADRVTGRALDFALLVTQRRHLDDLGLEVTGATAQEWMSIAQAFAGPAGPGREPLS